LDANGDGSIDEEELAALTGSDTDVSSLFSELDGDSDGSLNVDELAALAPPPPPPPPAAEASSDELFSQLDADSSGSISRDELSSLLDSIGQQAQASSKSSSSEEENFSGLIAQLLKQYQSNASYQSSIGSQLDLSA
ncbi:MAG: EF-hand domain-containing protein, partial [Pseudomonas sp.]